jgi:hypothetical protein
MSSALAGPPLTTIQDVLYKADGTPFNGTVTISWTTFSGPDNSTIPTQSKTVRVIDGNLRIQLVPNTSSTPAAIYTVTYNSDGNYQFQENWAVPASSTPLHISDVRTAMTTTGTGAGADTGDNTSILESGVTGLVADLAARAIKGPGYVAGTAVIDTNGLIEGAVGNSTDCVHVDGSSGPCGNAVPSFIDGNSPTGVVDGSNTAFGLSAVPDPVTSLAVYRNGVLQKTGQDYNLSGSTVTFVAAATPQPGDTLLASYRLAGSDGSSGSTAYTSTQVLCSGMGGSTGASTLTALGTCQIPAGLLAPGDRIEIRFGYAHTGSAGGFSSELKWGATAMFQRALPASETLLTGRADAAVLFSGAQIDSENWGAAAALAVSAATATDAYAGGLTITFQGSVAAGGDTLALTNFSVVRVP